MQHSRPRRGRGATGAAAVVVVAIALVVAAASGASAADGLDEVGSTTWSIRPGDGEARVSIELALRNTTEDTEEGRTYFDGYAIGLPMEPSEVEVRIGDDVVEHEQTRFDGGTPGISWDFPDRLYHDQQQVWTIELRFASAPPRSDFTAGPRVTDGFVMVPIWAWGADDADLVVRVPVALDARLGREVADDVQDGRDVFRRDDASTFSEFLVGASDAVDRDSRTFDIDATTVAVESWPDDRAWARRMSRFARRALPTLADWTGTPFEEDRLVIRETARPVAEGWGGWNDPDANVVSVGEDFDRALWTHELSHNWLDTTEFADEWLREGLAETVTAQLAGELGVRNPPEPRPSDLVLSEWGDELTRADAAAAEDPRAWYEVTDELYRGAHHVVGTIADEVGPRRFRRMVRMTLRERSAWGDLGTAVPSEAADWREFLDLAERVGGSERARRVLLARVVPDAGPVLERRDQATAAFDELAEDPWGMPTTIAADMHVWRFDEAEAAMGQARDVRADVDALAERAGALDQRLPDLEPAWLAGDFAGLSDRVARIDGVLDDLDTLRQRADAAGLPAPGVPVDVGSDDPDEMAARITAFGDAMDALEQAELELDRTGDDPVEVVGLAGSDPVTLRQSARTAIARGDVDGLAAATDAMAGLVDDADARGRLRLGGGALVVALLVGAAVVLLVRRRRRRGRPSVAASTDG